MKKFVCLLAALAVCGATVCAAAGIGIDPGAGFEAYNSGGDSSRVTEILGMTGDEFNGYCKDNNIVYFAVNGDNTKQIRVTLNETAFSAEIGNLSLLPDDKISELIPELTGSDEIRGTVEEKGGQKFVKVRVETADSGGEYSVLQYITVAGKKEYTLSFYTSGGEDADYTDKVFESFIAEDFGEASEESKSSPLKYIVTSAIVLLTAVCGVVLFTVIRDLKKRTD